MDSSTEQTSGNDDGTLENLQMETEGETGDLQLDIPEAKVEMSGEAVLQLMKPEEILQLQNLKADDILQYFSPEDILKLRQMQSRDHQTRASESSSESSHDETVGVETEVNPEDCDPEEMEELGTFNADASRSEDNEDKAQWVQETTEQEEISTESDTTFKIFVSNIPPGFLNSDLTDLFQAYGDVVECERVSKNYAFVHMGSEESGERAIVELNGLETGGCKMFVKRSVQSTGPPYAKSRRTDFEVGTYKIYVGNLCDDVSKDYVTNLLEPCGRIVEIEIYRGNSAFVHMETEAGGKQAIEQLNGKLLPESDTPLMVTNAKNPEGPSLPITKLKVTNLPASITAGALRDMFTSYGLVLKVRIFYDESDADPNASRIAIVHLEQFGNIRSAIKELSGKEVDGNMVRVEPHFEDEPPVNPKKPINPMSSSYQPPRSEPKPKNSQNFRTQKQLGSRPVLLPSPSLRPPHPSRRLIPMPSQAEMQRYPSFRPPKSLVPSMRLIPMPSQGEIQRYPSFRSPRPPQSLIPSMRLIPMPSQGEIERYPSFGSGRGRYLVSRSPDLRRPAFSPQFQQGGYHDEHEYNHDYSEPQNDDYDSYVDHEGSDWNQYDYNEYDQQTPAMNMNYPRPPPKFPRKNHQPQQNFSNPWGQFRQPKPNSVQNVNKQTSSAERGQFPSFPSPDKFPKGPPPSSHTQIPKPVDCDWSSDISISSFSQFSNSQDFVTNEPAAETNSLNAVPFDYTQVQKNKRTFHQAQATQPFPSSARYPNAQVYTNQKGQVKVRLERGGKNRKARRPGLGTIQQQAKTANQTGTKGLPTQQNHVEMHQQPSTSQSQSQFPSEGNPGSTNPSPAPRYFQQNWSIVKNKKQPYRKPTMKEMKEAEEEQKRQYADYLKQKPWLYQAIPGTVKRVQK